jgi:hypothetical protein
LDYVATGSAHVPSDPDKLYDAWITATDTAGNISDAVRIFEKVSGTRKDVITAKDFSRGLDEGTLSDLDAAKALARVEAQYAGGGDIATAHIIVDSTELGAINTAIGSGTKGTFDLTFYTPGPSNLGANPNFPGQDTAGSVTISVTLTDNGDSGIGAPADPGDDVQSIYGSGFSYAIADGDISAAEAKYLAGILLYDTGGTLMSQGDAVVDAAGLEALNARIEAKDKSGNPYDLRFETPDGESAITVKVTLFDEGESGGASGNTSIAANNFALPLKDVGALDDAAVRTLADVLAKDRDRNAVASTLISVDPAQLSDINAASVIGAYPLTFTYDDGIDVVSAEITVTLHTNKPFIAGEIKTSAGVWTSHATDTWTNKEVRVRATDNSDIPGDHYIAIYDGVSLEVRGSIYFAAAEKIYTAETAGTTLEGVLVDGSNIEISDRTDGYKVKIDQTKPVATAAYDTSGNSFTDISTDTEGALGSSQSGVDGSKTKVAVVPTGTTPEAGDYVDVAAASIPTGTEELYDAWVIATDIAGNVSDAAMVFEKVHSNRKDVIEALDFSRGLDEGALTDADAKALSHAAAQYAGGGAVAAADIAVDATELAAINDAITNGIKGEYDLTFTTPGPSDTGANPNFPGQDTSNTVTIRVKLTDSGVSNAAGESIYAGDFIWKVSGGELTADAAKYLSAVKAYDDQGAPIAQSDITVSSARLGAVNAAVRAGGSPSSLPLTFYTPDGTQVTVTVTLKDEADGEDQNSGEDGVLGANNFSYGVDEPPLTEDLAMVLAGA